MIHSKNSLQNAESVKIRHLSTKKGIKKWRNKCPLAKSLAFLLPIRDISYSQIIRYFLIPLFHPGLISIISITSRLGNTTSQIEPLLTTSTAKTLDQDTIMHLTELCMSLLFSLLIPLHHATDRVLHLATRVKSTMCKSHISLHKTSNYKQNHTHSYGLYDLASACFSELISYHFPLCPKCSMNASFLPIFQTHHINFLSLSLYLFL